MWLEGLAERACPPAPVPRPPQPMRPNLTTSEPAARTPCGTMSCEEAARVAVAAAVVLRKFRREGEVLAVLAAGWVGFIDSPQSLVGKAARFVAATRLFSYTGAGGVFSNRDGEGVQ